MFQYPAPSAESAAAAIRAMISTIERDDRKLDIGLLPGDAPSFGPVDYRIASSAAHGLGESREARTAKIAQSADCPTAATCAHEMDLIVITVTLEILAEKMSRDEMVGVEDVG
jgi:hypothetical protein